MMAFSAFVTPVVSRANDDDEKQLIENYNDLNEVYTKSTHNLNVSIDQYKATISAYQKQYKAAISIAPHIRIISPKSGAKLDQNQPFKVEWQGVNLGDSPVTINLVPKVDGSNDGRPLITLATSTLNDGTESFNISSAIILDGKYTLEVRSVKNTSISATTTKPLVFNDPITRTLRVDLPYRGTVIAGQSTSTKFYVKNVPVGTKANVYLIASTTNSTLTSLGQNPVFLSTITVKDSDGFTTGVVKIPTNTLSGEYRLGIEVPNKAGGTPATLVRSSPLFNVLTTVPTATSSQVIIPRVTNISPLTVTVGEDLIVEGSNLSSTTVSLVLLGSNPKVQVATQRVSLAVNGNFFEVKVASTTPPGVYTSLISNGTSSALREFQITVRAVPVASLSVTSQTSPESWVKGSKQTVRWTDKLIASNKKVAISLVNGTTEKTLVNLPVSNDGSQVVIVPDIESGNWKVKVKLVGDSVNSIEATSSSSVEVSGIVRAACSLVTPSTIRSGANATWGINGLSGGVASTSYLWKFFNVQGSVWAEILSNSSTSTITRQFTLPTATTTKRTIGAKSLITSGLQSPVTVTCTPNLVVNPN